MDRVNQWLTLAANIGVFAGIVFLVFEIQQNTAQMRAEAAYSIHEDAQRLNEAIYQDADFTDLIMRAEQSFASLDANEQRRAQAYFFSQLNLADFIMGLREEGISDVSYGFVDLRLKEFRSMPGRKEFIKSRLKPLNAGDHNFRSDELYRQLVSD
ncbi:MAG: hypothetical protein P8X82_10850 [Gemmatimonadales bacterium]